MEAVRRRTVRAPLAGLAIFFLAAAGARADHRASYEKGMKAIDQTNWYEAFDALHEAVAEKPIEGERILIYGMRYQPYLPYFYLGLAYFRTGNCRAAVRSWAESDRQGPVRTAAEYKRLVEMRDGCLAQEQSEEKLAQAAGSGLLVIDALPWGRVERLDDSAGKSWLARADTFTPFSVAVPPGEYSAVVTSAAFPGKRLTLVAHVRTGHTATCVGRFEPVDPKAYLKSQGWKP